jgi:molybdopterin molybdotransferase
MKPGEAIRIFTGAPTPEDVFGVVMQEDVDVLDDAIVLKESVGRGEMIRRRGAEFHAGSVLAPVGTAVDAGVAAQLAFCNLINPLVFEPPRVAVITTGDELVRPGGIGKPVGVIDTNSVMLSLQVANSVPVRPDTMKVSDNRAKLLEAIGTAAHVNELIVISGGASVGDRDYIGAVIAELGTIHFHGVSIRPGKPTLFGSIGGCQVFGLPGNPASSFVCFELFVREALRRLAGWNDAGLRWMEAEAGFAHRSCGREDYVRVRLEDGVLQSAGEQGSFGIGSMARAHGLARFPGDRDTEPGERCQVSWLK